MGSGESGPRSDDVEVVTDDVAEHQSDDGRGRCGRGEAAPLDRRDVFPDRVDLVDRRPARKQFVSHGPEPVQREVAGGCREEGAPAATDDRDDEGPIRRGFGSLPDRFGRRRAPLARDRVVTTGHGHPLRLRGVVGDDDSAVDGVTEHRFEGRRDLAGRVPGTQDDDLVELAQRVRGPVDAHIVVACFDCRLDDRPRMGSVDPRLDARERQLAGLGGRERRSVLYHTRGQSLLP